jgi:hypothetical protein
VTAPPEQASGFRLLAALLSLAVLALLVSELDQEKRQLLAPTTVAAGAPLATEAPHVTPSSPRARVVERAPVAPLVASSHAASVTASPEAVAVMEQPPSTTPVRPGHYQFAYSVDGQPSQAASLDVRRLPARSGIHDEQTWSTSDDYAVQDHDWAPNQMRTTSSGPCRWRPADITLVLPLRKGAQWTSRTSCRNEDGSDTSTTTSSTVKGWTKVTIGTQRVPTWVIERSIATVVSSPRATARSWSAVTDFFAPGLGLTVVESMQSHYPAPDGGDRTIDAVRRLLSVVAS